MKLSSLPQVTPTADSKIVVADGGGGLVSVSKIAPTIISAGGSSPGKLETISVKTGVVLRTGSFRNGDIYNNVRIESAGGTLYVDRNTGVGQLVGMSVSNVSNTEKKAASKDLSDVFPGIARVSFMIEVYTIEENAGGDSTSNMIRDVDSPGDFVLRYEFYKSQGYYVYKYITGALLLGIEFAT